MPLWPQGVAGSIAHCEGFCAAVVARKAGGPAGQGGALRSLGLDIERRARMDLAYAPHILTGAEQRDLLAPDPARDGFLADPALRLALVFSAKEAFYKAQFPLSGQFLDFRAVSVGLARTGFTVRLEQPIAGLGDSGVHFAGRYAIVEHHVLTGLIL
jgi:4'-phosphopantetheinyl transferase EntD